VTARALTLGVVVGMLATACGSGSPAKASPLDAGCKHGREALARVGPIQDLGDATTALRAIVRLDRRALADVEASGAGHGRLAGRLRGSIQTTERSLHALVASDPQQTMVPMRTGVSNARRAAGDAQALVGSLCGQGPAAAT
jgi:hypothetical protein